MIRLSGYLIGFFFLIFGQSLSGQKDSTVVRHEGYQIFMGTDVNTVLDENLSPVLLQGGSFFTTLQFNWKRVSTALKMDIGGLGLSGQFNDVDNFGVQSQTFWRAKKEAIRLNGFKLNVDVGLSPGMRLKNHKYFTNNPGSFEFITEAGPRINIRKQLFSWLGAEYSLYYSLFAYVSRPFYGTQTPQRIVTPERYEIDWDGAFKEIVLGGDWTSVNSYHRLQSEVYLKFRYKNGKYFHLKYQWNFMNYKGVEQLKAAQHALSFIVYAFEYEK